ncbi:MAG TPA: hypothetical protein VMT74_10600 [Gaiellaceae bacterium]|nr:hypothetical protein [Gaiellaceae bacterium]
MRPSFRTRWLVAAAAAAAALAVVPAALADPPPNDNRDSAAPIPTFPATIQGTTVDATVERLDPQISQCGQIEGTVWYRIDQAPDGTVALTAQGAGLAPVLRVYSLVKNGIQELDCSSAPAGGTADVAFDTKRGASYLVVVGHKPSTPDGAFELDAKLFLPPTNDTRGQAAPLGKVPAKVNGSTVGATTDSNDPEDCGLAGGTVWYSVSPGKAERLVLTLRAAGDLDAAVAVVSHLRSEYDTVACGQTDKQGDAALAWDVEQGASYLIVVGQRKGSGPGSFALDVLSGTARETAPGTHLAAAGVTSTVNWLTDVNDVYWTTMTAGTTYRIAFRSPDCAMLVLENKGSEIGHFSCSGYTTFTPGPDGGGRYVFEVLAPRRSKTAEYRLQVAGAGPDDQGMGLELGNLSTVHGSLSPAGIDVVDLYHFDVAQASEVRLRLGRQEGRDFAMALLTDDGRRISGSDNELQLHLQPAHYVVAVHGAVGSPAGRYTLGLVIRQLTQTSVTASASSIAPGGSVTFTLRTSPPPDAGVLELEIDRFDPLMGWQFSKLIRVPAPGGSVTWTPPALGRWRARVRYLGTLEFSPSESGYVTVQVAKPLR